MILWLNGWHSFLWMWGVSQRIPFVCFGSKPTQRASTRDFPRDQKKADNRRKQNRTVNRREESTEVGGSRRSEKGKCGTRGRVGQRERMSQRFWWLCRNFARIHARDSPQKATEKCHKVLFLRFVLTHVRDCSSFLPPSRLCMLCFMFIKKCEITLAGDERNQQTIGWPWVV